MAKRYTILSTSESKPVIHFQADSINEAKEKGQALATARKIELAFIVEGWTQPAGHIEEGGEIIKVG